MIAASTDVTLKGGAAVQTLQPVYAAGVYLLKLIFIYLPSCT